MDEQVITYWAIEVVLLGILYASCSVIVFGICAVFALIVLGYESYRYSRYFSEKHPDKYSEMVRCMPSLRDYLKVAQDSEDEMLRKNGRRLKQVVISFCIWLPLALIAMVLGAINRVS